MSDFSIFRTEIIYLLNLPIELAHFSVCVFNFWCKLSFSGGRAIYVTQFAFSIFRCVVFNNRGIAGEDLLVRMTFKINIFYM